MHSEGRGEKVADLQGQLAITSQTLSHDRQQLDGRKEISVSAFETYIWSNKESAWASLSCTIIGDHCPCGAPLLYQHLHYNAVILLAKFILKATNLSKPD